MEVLGPAAEPEAAAEVAGLLLAEVAEDTGRVALLTPLDGAETLVGRMVALPVTGAEPDALPEAPPAPMEKRRERLGLREGEMSRGDLPPAHVVCWSWIAAAWSSGEQAETH